MLFTVVTPSFRQLDWLELCIASVADQVAPSSGELALEHLVEDAGSPGAEARLRALGAEIQAEDAAAPGGTPPSYRLSARVAPDRGMYDAVNRGLRRARGELVAYLNCDEQYLPGTLRRVAATFARDPSLEVLLAGAIVVDPTGRYVCERRPVVPTAAQTRLSGTLSFFTSSTFVRASVFRERALWFDPTWRAAGDAEWALRLLEAGVRMCAVGWPASAHTDTGDNLSLSPVAFEEADRLAAPWGRIAPLARPFVRRAFHARKLAAGAYRPAHGCYRIYTLEEPGRRRAFDIDRPTWRWARDPR